MYIIIIIPLFNKPFRSVYPLKNIFFYYFILNGDELCIENICFTRYNKI